MTRGHEHKRDSATARCNSSIQLSNVSSGTWDAAALSNFSGSAASDDISLAIISPFSRFCGSGADDELPKELPKDLGGLRGLCGLRDLGGLRDLPAHLGASGGDRSVRAFRTACSKFLIWIPHFFGFGLSLVSPQWLWIQRKFTLSQCQSSPNWFSASSTSWLQSVSDMKDYEQCKAMAIHLSWL